MSNFIPLELPEVNTARAAINKGKAHIFYPKFEDIPELDSHCLSIVENRFLLRATTGVCGLKIKDRMVESIAAPLITTCLSDESLDEVYKVQAATYMLMSWYDMFSEDKFLLALDLYNEFCEVCKNITPCFVAVNDSAEKSPAEYSDITNEYYAKNSHNFSLKEVVYIFQNALHALEKIPSHLSLV